MIGATATGTIVTILIFQLVVLRYTYVDVRDTLGAKVRAEYVTAYGVECPGCGEQNEMGYEYCSRCGSELPGRPAPTEPTASQWRPF